MFLREDFPDDGTRSPSEPCLHKRVVESGADTICVGCGTVLNDCQADKRSIYDNGMPAPNLYVAKSLGSANHPKMENLRRYYRGGIATPERALSQFSNVCEALRLPPHVREHAWKLYRICMKKMPRKPAEHACVAIYYACRVNGILRTEHEISEAVKKTWGRSTMPNMIKLEYRHINIFGDAISPDDDRKEEYYFNLYLHRITGSLNLSEIERNRRKRRAWMLFTEICTVGNLGQRATNAIRMGFSLDVRVKGAQL